MRSIATHTQVGVCPHGCPVIVMRDENGNETEAHIPAASLEGFIADLREAAATGEAMQRPVS